ncbi:MAG: hypothetical protein KGH93_01155 [Patescibacteria group bacterium]|nr:hypothetical protein [Patescibacteria group bacterium]MDE1945789.1 hypothetical protein [Patescibacteria group bacterium]
MEQVPLLSGIVPVGDTGARVFSPDRDLSSEDVWGKRPKKADAWTKDDIDEFVRRYDACIDAENSFVFLCNDNDDLYICVAHRNGSGVHVMQSVWSSQAQLFAPRDKAVLRT